MTNLSRGKVIAYLAAIFVAGGVSGALISWRITGHRRFVPPNAQRIADHLRARLTARLGLTPDQVRKIDPVISQTARDIVVVRRELGGQIAVIMAKADARIAGDLTPAQQKKLAQLAAERRALFHPQPLPPPAAPGGAGQGPER